MSDVIVAIDLSLRSTGLVALQDNRILEYDVITSDAKKLNKEELLIFNSLKIMDFIDKYQPDKIGLEGLSFGSISSSKDILAGNFWKLRTDIFKAGYPIDIIAVLTWRSSLFNKEERKLLKENSKKLKLLRKEWKLITDKVEKTQILKDNNELILNSNIKWLTWLKLPANIREEFEKVGFSKGGADLCDAYFIARYISGSS